MNAISPSQLSTCTISARRRRLLCFQGVKSKIFFRRVPLPKMPYPPSTTLRFWCVHWEVDVLACESEQQHVVILVRNEGQSQHDQGNMW